MSKLKELYLSSTFFRYCAMAGLPFITDVFLFSLIKSNGGSILVSVVVSVTLASSLSFLLNKYFVFASKRIELIAPELLKFIVTTGFVAVVGWYLMIWIDNQVDSDAMLVISRIGVLLAGWLGKFFFLKVFVFVDSNVSQS